MKKSSSLYSKRLFKSTIARILLIVFATATSYANGSAMISFTNHSKVVSLKEVIWELEKQTDFVFIYSSDDLENIEFQNIEFQNEDVQTVLDRCLDGTGLTYEIKNDVVVIKKAKKMPKPLPPKKQEQQVSGTILDEKGLPIPGASILLQGTQKGTISDVDGKFTLSVPDLNEAVLEISFVGMLSETIQVKGRLNIDVVLVNDIAKIDEVVVTGYSTISKDAYSGSAALVSSEKVEERPVASVEEALIGNATGVSFAKTGQPGGPTYIRLRGIGSMNASRSPTYVIDGIIWETSNISGNAQYAQNPLSTLNPSDIENITILKDAASTSLYGHRGANGVIVITTKQGKTNKPSYDIEMQTGISHAAKFSLPDLSTSRDEFKELWVEGEMHYQLARVVPRDDLFTEIKNLYGDKENYLIDGWNFHQWQEDAQNEFNSHFRIAMDASGEFYDYDFFGADADKLPEVDWYDEVTRQAQFQKFNLSSHGGNENLAYYASLEYFNQEGVLLASHLKRYSLRLNLNSKPTNQLIHWGINNMVSHAEMEGPRADANGYAMPQYTATAIAPVAPPYLDDGSINLFLPKNVNGNQNPLAVAKYNTYSRPQTKINSTAWIQANFTDYLYFKSNNGIDYTMSRRRHYADKDFGDGLKDKGSLIERDARKYRWTSTNLLHFNKTFLSDHHISAYFGTEFSNMEYNYTYVNAVGFVSDDNPYLDGASLVQEHEGTNRGDAEFSIISSLNYAYLNKYYLSGSFRQDQSSRLAPDERKGNFWSVSGSWRISAENFMKGAAFLNDLRLKASVGTNGTLPTEYYLWQNNYTAGANYNGSGAIVPAYIPSLFIGWEESFNFNMGFDASLFDFINLEVEYFQRKSSELIQDLSISHTSGFEYKTLNTSDELKNQGVEVSLNADIITTGNWLWNVEANISTLKNEYSNLAKDEKFSRTIRRNGEARYTWYLPEWAGVDPQTGEQQWYTTNESGEKVITKDYDEAEQVVSGQATPKINGGFSSSVRWKNLEFSFLFTFGAGHKAFDYTGGYQTQNDGYRDYRNFERDQLDRWTPDNPNGKNPLRINTSRIWKRYYSTRYLYDADYLKLKNIKLHYTLPNNLAKYAKVSGASLFLQAENLFVLTEMKGYDPEISINGRRDMDQFPTATTYTVGLKLTL